MPTRMLLVRHGQSEWNAAGRWQGQADPPLTPLGSRQAALAAERLGTVDLIVASDLERALRTALIISELLGVGPVLIDERLRERDAGEWSGLTRDEIEAAWPGYLDEGRRPPGFEDDESLFARTHDSLAHIERSYEGATVLVITHGGVVYTLERSEGLGWERLPNLAGRWLDHHRDRVVLGDRVVLVDDDHVTTVPAQI